MSRRWFASYRLAEWPAGRAGHLPVVGFSLYMIKAVLSGRGDEVIDLAKTNLLR